MGGIDLLVLFSGLWLLSNKTFISREKYSRCILSDYVVYMEIIIRHNSVYLKNPNLGKGCSDFMADLTVDNFSRVKVKTTCNLSFYTDLDHLPIGILNTISKRIARALYLKEWKRKQITE
jgi:hypothetical protein